ncbi:MAG: hypothetical protein NTW52_19375 [Planctomycetota bacterium]|nr:hypothetical protein [Planctomycetota bacterium]
MLFPVCSLGAIPVMTELRKAGLIGGTILAFGLTASIFNPLSVLYGLTLSQPVVIFTICLASLALVTIMGLFWDRVFKSEFIEPEPMATAKTLIYDSTPAFAGYSLAIYAALVLLGGVVYAIDPNQSWEQRLSGTNNTQKSIDATNSEDSGGSAPHVQPLSRDIMIPPKITGLIAIGGLFWASIYGCYLYYPPRHVAYEQLQVSNAEVSTRVMSKDWTGAMYWIPSVEDWLRKLQVGMYLRGESFSPDQFKQLEALMHSVDAQYRRARRSYH